MKARDEFYSFRKLLKFGWNFFAQPSEITLSFGKPLDVMGNFVDEDGNSTDRFGNPVEVKEYFMTDGKVTEDLQREMEYTKILSDRIVERYFKENIVLSSHIVAFAAFAILKNQNPRLDLFGVLRLPTDDYIFPMELMRNVVGQLKDVLIDLNKNGRIKLSKQVFHEVDKLIGDGVRNLGVYHVEKPLVINKKGELESEDFKLLYFYYNRLENYGLEKAISWEKIPVVEEMEVEVA
jgi:glycerol-3-phosphate O-acyltransferase